MAKPNGFIFYRGASVLDGAPIVGIATLSSSNIKTGPNGRGNMVQTWILRADVNPMHASKNKLDASICGSCPHRHSLGGACYVNIGQAPLGIYRAFERGNYPDYSNNPEAIAAALDGRSVRMGAYGDPAAIPVPVWESLLVAADGWTGYTHQSRHPNFDAALLRYCMASADTPKQAQKLHGMGARTFRVKTESAPMLAGEIECLSDSKGIKCIDCGLCNGRDNAAPNIVINVHGSRSTNFERALGGAQLIARS